MMETDQVPETLCLEIPKEIWHNGEPQYS